MVSHTVLTLDKVLVVLDHVFTDAIGALRDALEEAMLERQALEERFQTDVLLGDLTWETSYGLPGEGSPPRVQVDLTLEWPTWAQTAYRTWFLEETFTESPHIEIGVVFRVQRLASPPEPTIIVDAFPRSALTIGTVTLDRAAPTMETRYDDHLKVLDHAVEVGFQTSYPLSEAILEDGSVLDQQFADLGSWILSALVRLGDVPLGFLPGRTP